MIGREVAFFATPVLVKIDDFCRRIDEAQAEAKESLKGEPGFSTRYRGETEPFKNDADLRHFLDGYRKAGLPE